MDSPLDIQDEYAHRSTAFQFDGRRSVELSLEDLSGFFTNLACDYPRLVADAVVVSDHVIGVFAVTVEGALRSAVTLGRSQTF